MNISPTRSIARGPVLAALLAGALAAASACSEGAGEAPQASCATLPASSGGAQVCGGVDTVTVGATTAYPRVYRGIPYARAPQDSLRWVAPRDTSLTGTISATSFGKICPQGNAPADTARMSEACLFLNVWAPASSSPANPVPVMVFIHGGAFVIGSGSGGMYRGAYLAAADSVVVVTLNYRLGALGFLAGGVVGADSTPVLGNFGLLDQQKAMQWVRRNIGAFGGDSSKVTIFGESAGAMSVGFHLFAIPSSDSLFRAAIMESNPITIPYRDSARAGSDADGFIHKLCRTQRGVLACDFGRKAWFTDNGQTVPLDSVLTAQSEYDSISNDLYRFTMYGLQEGLPWTPVVDGRLVRGQPVNGYAAAMPRAKPFVFGTNRNEGVLFADVARGGLTVKRYGDLLVRLFGTDEGSVTGYRDSTGAYPYRARGHASDFGMDSTTSAFARLLSDYVFTCGNLAAADSALGRQGSLPAYGYQFRRTPLPLSLYSTAAVPACASSTGAVCHADELPYVFNTLSYADTLNGDTVQPRPVDTALAVEMAGLWGYFAKNLAMPPASGWQAYTKNGSVFAFGDTVPTTMWAGLPAAANCPLWSRVGRLKASAAETAAALPAGGSWGVIPPRAEAPSGR